MGVHGMTLAGINVTEHELAAFCRKWKIARLEAFGSVLREDFGPESDVDFLVTFRSDAAWSLSDHAAMEEELGELVGRRVDLVTRAAIEQSRNWIRRKHMLENVRIVYKS
jgi:uncharacterized protein